MALGMETRVSGHRGSMKRPTTLTIAAILLLLASAFLVLAFLGAPIVLYRLQRPVNPRLLFWAIPNLGIPAWWAATAVGLLRLRPWARVSLLVVASVAAYHYIGNALALLLCPGPATEDSIWLANLGLTLVLLGCGGVAALGLVQFSQGTMDDVFRPDAEILQSEQAATGGLPNATATRSMLAAKRPLSTTTIAVWLLAMLPLGLYEILLRVHKILLPFPTRPIGAVLEGSVGVAYYVAFAVVGVALGFGLLRMKSWAHAGTIALSAFTIVSEIAVALWPDAYPQASQVMNSAMSLRASRLSIGGWTLWSIVPPAAAMWLLITRKQVARR